MHYPNALNSKKTLKYGVFVLMVGFILLFGNIAANGEELTFTGYDSALDSAECIDFDVYGHCDEVELPYDLVEEKTVYPEVETRPAITWQKNAVSLGNFTPDMIYVLEDNGSTFQIVETQSIGQDDEEINLVAFGMDENDNDYYTFHMAYKNGGSDWKSEFVSFVTNFKN